LEHAGSARSGSVGSGHAMSETALMNHPDLR
jgi:hypothetical protein